LAACVRFMFGETSLALVFLLKSCQSRKQILKIAMRSTF